MIATSLLPRALTVPATTASVRREECTVEDMGMVGDMVGSCPVEYGVIFHVTGKKYCYGSTEGEHCNCDFCKVVIP